MLSQWSLSIPFFMPAIGHVFVFFVKHPAFSMTCTYNNRGQ